MANAYIKLVPASTTQNITLGEIKDSFNYYKEITSKTGEQLGWEYREAAFPYQIKQVDTANNWIYLKSDVPNYNAIIIGIGTEQIVGDDGEVTEQNYVQVTLPQVSTFGDKGKANEFCKYLGKKLQGELHLFNGRVMYFYKRK